MVEVLVDVEVSDDTADVLVNVVLVTVVCSGPKCPSAAAYDEPTITTPIESSRRMSVLRGRFILQSSLQ